MHTDVYTEFIPWRHSTRQSLARGEWGLWNPYAMSGEVLLGSQQTAVYSPFTLIACLMPVALSFTYTAAITFFTRASRNAPASCCSGFGVAGGNDAAPQSHRGHRGGSRPRTPHS